MEAIGLHLLRRETSEVSRLGTNVILKLCTSSSTGYCLFKVCPSDYTAHCCLLFELKGRAVRICVSPKRLTCKCQLNALDDDGALLESSFD